MSNAVSAPILYPAYLVDLQFADNTYHAWLGIGSIVANGNTYLGVGTFGSISTIGEGTGVEAKGVTLKLSGIDPTMLAEAQSEITLASRATVYLAFLTSTGTLVDTPLCLFTGIMDGPEFDIDTNTSSISIDVESKMIDLNRSRGGRLTAQDQRARYPNDSCLDWVSKNQDSNLIWKA
jgi:hypothetical protein